MAALPKGVAPKQSWVEARLLRTLEECVGIDAIGLEATALSPVCLARAAEVVLVRRSAAMDAALAARYPWSLRSHHLDPESNRSERLEEWPPQEVRLPPAEPEPEPAQDGEEGKEETDDDDSSEDEEEEEEEEEVEAAALARSLSRAMVGSLRFGAPLEMPTGVEASEAPLAVGKSASMGTLPLLSRAGSGLQWRQQWQRQQWPHTSPLKPVLLGERHRRASDKETPWRGLLSVGENAAHTSLLWASELLEQLELARRREEGDWRAFGFRKPAPKLLQPLGSKMTIKRWDAEEASGGREVYRDGQSAVSEEAATQEAEQEALVALLAWFDRDGRW